MNAPGNAAAVMPAAFELIPIQCIKTSDTHIQALRRKHFDPQKLLDLADSIQAQGVLQPVLVRPVKPNGTVKYEIVAGERRFIASDRSGLAHVPCLVRELTDAQVLEAQLVENLQREDVSILEEIEGYAELRKLKNLKADELAALIGKSKAYVYARLKLLDLCPEAREALDAGKLDGSKALLVARLPNAKLQMKALKLVTYADWRGDPISYRGAFAELRKKLMQDLHEAPFALDDGSLDPVPCTLCPHNSHNDAELQAGLDEGAHVCTDAPCFEHKAKVFWQRKRAAAEAEQRTILTGDAAKAAIPAQYSSGVSEEYVDLDARCDAIEFPEPEPKDESSPEWDAWEARACAWRAPTFRELLGDAKISTVFAEDKGGKLRELVPIAEAQRPLKKKKVDIEPAPRQRSMEPFDSEKAKRLREAQEARQAKERTFRERVFREVHAKLKGRKQLEQPDLAVIADRMSTPWEGRDLLAELYPRPDPGQMPASELVRYVLLLAVANDVGPSGNASRLFDVAKRLKIDPATIKQHMTDEERAITRAEAQPTAAKPAAKKKAPAKKKAAKK